MWQGTLQMRDNCGQLRSWVTWGVWWLTKDSRGKELSQDIRSSHRKVMFYKGDNWYFWNFFLLRSIVKALVWYLPFRGCPIKKMATYYCYSLCFLCPEPSTHVINSLYVWNGIIVFPFLFFFLINLLPGQPYLRCFLHFDSLILQV